MLKHEAAFKYFFMLYTFIQLIIQIDTQLVIIKDLYMFLKSLDR